MSGRTATEITIRPWQPDDDAAVWSVLQEGSHSNINATFKLCMKKPVMRALSVIVVAVGLINRLSIVALVPCFLCGIALIYGIAVLSSYIYLYSSTLSDIKDIQETYFSDCDNHFWVAECDGEIAGTIAIIKKDDIASPNHETNDCPGFAFHGKKIAWLRRMVVRTKFRGMGIAKCLVHEALEFCGRRHYDGVFLITTEVHHAARSLYSYIGFSLLAIKPYRYLKGFIKVKTFEYYLKL